MPAGKTKKVVSSDASSEILPHHTFHRLVGPLVVLRILFFVVVIFNIPFDQKIDQLPNRHACVHAHGLYAGNFEGPGIGKADVSFAGRGVNIDAQAADAAFTLQKWYGMVRFGVLFRNAEVKRTGLEYETLGTDFEQIDRIVLFGIQHPVAVNGQVFPQVYVVGVGAEAFCPERLDNDLAFSMASIIFLSVRIIGVSMLKSAQKYSILC